MAIGITAIIPTFNRERTISRAVRSALEQSLAPAEIIVVDDGSTDATQDLLQTFGHGIKCIRQERSGVSAARNAAAAAAKSEWIAFLDSDDYWLPDHLSNIALAIESTEDKASCYFSNATFDLDRGVENYWARCEFNVPGPHCLREDAIDWAMMRIQPMLLPASVIRRKAYWEVGGLNPFMTTREDTLLFHQLALRYPFCAVEGIGLVVTDDGPQRLTRIYDSGHAAYWTSSILMYEQLLSDVKGPRPGCRQSIKWRLSDAHTGMAMYRLQKGEVEAAARSLLAAAVAAPVHFLTTSLAKIARKFKILR